MTGEHHDGDEEFWALLDATWELDGRVFGRPADYSEVLPTATAEDVDSLVDHLFSLCLADVTDPAHPWWLGHALRGIGRLREAAAAYLWAAHLDLEDARHGTAAVDDPLEWRTSALELAADLLEKEGLTVSAGKVRRLSEADPEPPTENEQ